jgi:hypothetical protein
MKNNFSITKEILNKSDLGSPKGYKEFEVEDFLDVVKEFGEINMYAATPLIMKNFECDKKVAREWLSYYMNGNKSKLILEN